MNWGESHSHKKGGRDMADKVPIWEKTTLTKEEAMEYSNLGSNTLGRLMNMPNNPFILKVGRRRLIKRKEFEQFLSDTYEL